jgi:hypothetical protein
MRRRRSGAAAGCGRRLGHVVAEGLAVVVAVAEEVEVLAIAGGRSMTQGQGLSSPCLKLKSSESKSGRVESSTTAQPERERQARLDGLDVVAA